MNKEEIINCNINSLLIDNELEQNKLNFEAKKEEIYKNKLQEKDKELERYKNIIDELKKENEKLHKQVREYQDEIFARDNNWYDMCD